MFLSTPLMTSSLAATTQEGGQEDMNSIPDTDRAHLEGEGAGEIEVKLYFKEVKSRSFHLA